MSRAKEKGNYFEETISKKIRKHYSLEIRDVHRAQNSGVFSTEYGDVYFRKHKIIIECKNQNVVDASKLFPYLTKEVYDFYKQVHKDFISYVEKYPDEFPLELLAITNSSRRLPHYCIIEFNHFNKIISKNIIDSKILTDKSASVIFTKYKNQNDMKFIVFIFDELLPYLDISKLEY